jgi:hypothetical protein
MTPLSRRRLGRASRHWRSAIIAGPNVTRITPASHGTPEARSARQIVSAPPQKTEPNSGGNATHHSGRPRRRIAYTPAAAPTTSQRMIAASSGSQAVSRNGAIAGGGATICSSPNGVWYATDQGSPPASQTRAAPL